MHGDKIRNLELAVSCLLRQRINRRRKLIELIEQKRVSAYDLAVDHLTSPTIGSSKLTCIPLVNSVIRSSKASGNS